MTMAAENFIEEGHTELKLSDGIYQAYLKVYKQDRTRAKQMLNQDKQTAQQQLANTIFGDKTNGFSLLLVLVFYLGLNHGKSEAKKNHLMDVVKFNPVNNRFMQQERNKKIMNGENGNISPNNLPSMS